MIEDEKIILGTGAVILQIMCLCGLAIILPNQGVDNKSIIKLGDLTKWLCICGDSLTQVRLKSVMDAIYSYIISFKYWYSVSLNVPAKFEKNIIGDGVFHVGGVSYLRCVFKAY